MSFLCGSTPLTMPTLRQMLQAWGAVFGQAAQDANASGFGGGCPPRRGRHQRRGLQAPSLEPKPRQTPRPALNNRARGAFQPFGRRELELVRHERRRHIGVAAPVAIVGHDGLDAVGRHKILPQARSRSTCLTNDGTCNDAQEISASRVLDFGSGFGVKRDVFLVK